MAKTQSTRISVDLLEAAEVEGVREHRSMAQQIEHWARVGREVTMRDVAGRRMVERALEGAPPSPALEAAVRYAAEAETNARIQERMLTTPMDRVLRREGIDAVGLDAEGRIVEYRVDGTQHVVGGPADHG